MEGAPGNGGVDGATTLGGIKAAPATGGVEGASHNSGVGEAPASASGVNGVEDKKPQRESRPRMSDIGSIHGVKYPLVFPQVCNNHLISSDI